MNINAKQLGPDQVQLWENLRAKALQEKPDTFAKPDVEKGEKPQPKDITLPNDNLAIFGAFDSGKMIGIAKISIADWMPPVGTYAVIGSTWLEPEYRNNENYKLMLQAAIEWAKAKPSFKEIIAAIGKPDPIEQKNLEEVGFVYDHTEKDRLWADGSRSDNIWYKLPLN